MSQSDDQANASGAGHAAALVGFLIAFGLAAAIWRFAPTGPLPVHMSLQGRVDGWSDRTHVAILAAGVTAVSALSYTAMGLLTGSIGRNLKATRLVLVLVTVMSIAILAGAAFGVLNGPDLGPNRLQPAILSLLFVITGALIGKASPNPLVGVRTYWALRSRLSWDKSNRLAGRLFFAIGALGLVVSVLAPPPLVITAILIAAILSAIIVVVESWRVWRNDPDRPRT